MGAALSKPAEPRLNRCPAESGGYNCARATDGRDQDHLIHYDYTYDSLWMKFPHGQDEWAGWQDGGMTRPMVLTGYLLVQDEFLRSQLRILMEPPF
jgi:hypothetical protein